jgi:hypothetical protein
MANFSLPRFSHRHHAAFIFTIFAIVSAVMLQSKLRAETQPIKAAPVETSGGAKRSEVKSRGEIFVELAKTVGQSVPAKRLVDFKAKTDPTSQPRYWGIVDFNQHSTAKRFYVFDTVQGKVETYFTSHGRGSEGAFDDGMADVFSNQDSSFGSSLGVYRALDEYVGKHGRSMRLAGLEATNSNALSRAIVLHKAAYVSEAVIRKTGRLGRSQGCFAVENSVGDRLIDQLKNGAYIIAWKA